MERSAYLCVSVCVYERVFMGVRVCVWHGYVVLSMSVKACSCACMGVGVCVSIPEVKKWTRVVCPCSEQGKLLYAVTKLNLT